MNELLSINQSADRITVSARDLHEALQIKTRFNDWFPRMADYGFEKGADYEAITQKRVTAQGNTFDQTGYQITIEMAKQICMLQRSELGRRSKWIRWR